MAALFSVWAALGVFVAAVIVLWTRPAAIESLIPLLFYAVALIATVAAGVLWASRRRPRDEPGVAARRTQALVAIGILAVTVAVLYVSLVGWGKGLLGLAIEAAALWTAWWIYKTVVLRE